MKYPFLFALILFFIFGCATANYNLGKDFDQTKTSQIIKDKSTKDEIAKLFGQPYSKNVTSEKETWKYFYQQITSSAQSFLVTTVKTNTQVKSLDVVFENGIVKDYSYTFQPFQKQE